jgi:hypothetical protein
MGGNTVIPWKVYLTDVVPEGATRVLTLTFLDEFDAPIGSATLTTLKLTLYEEVTKAIINSRTHQSILGVNGGSVSAGGVLTLNLGALDNVVKRVADGSVETHVALLEYTWDTGTKANLVEIYFPVGNVVLVPA